MTNVHRNTVSRVFTCLLLTSALTLGVGCPGNSGDSDTDQPTTASEVVLTEPVPTSSISVTDPTDTDSGPKPTTSWGSSTTGDTTEGEWTATIASDGGSGSGGETTDETTSTTSATEVPQWCEPFEDVTCTPPLNGDWCGLMYDLAIEYGIFDPYLQIIVTDCREGTWGCDLCFYAANTCVQLFGGEQCEAFEEQCRCLADGYGTLHP